MSEGSGTRRTPSIIFFSPQRQHSTVRTEELWLFYSGVLLDLEAFEDQAAFPSFDLTVSGHMRAISSIFAFGDEQQVLYWGVQTFEKRGRTWNSGLAARRYSGLHNVHDTVPNHHTGWSPERGLVETKFTTKFKIPGIATCWYSRLRVDVVCT